MRHHRRSLSISGADRLANNAEYNDVNDCSPSLVSAVSLYTIAYGRAAFASPTSISHQSPRFGDAKPGEKEIDSELLFAVEFNLSAFTPLLLSVVLPAQLDGGSSRKVRRWPGIASAWHDVRR